MNRPSHINPTLCNEVSGLLKTVAHPQRLMILCLLTDGPQTVSELERASGASQSSVSQFLNRMKSEGLVQAKRSGQYVHYDIAHPKLRKLLLAMYKIFCDSNAS